MGKHGFRRAWWFRRQHSRAKGKRSPREGMEVSISILVKQWVDDGQFVGILGFSQGGGCCGVVMKELRDNYPQKLPKFAILVSAFRPLPGLERTEVLPVSYFSPFRRLLSLILCM